MLTHFSLMLNYHLDIRNTLDIDAFFEEFIPDMVYYVSEGNIYYGFNWYGEFEVSDYTLENGVLIIEEDVLEEGGEPLQWTKVQE